MKKCKVLYVCYGLGNGGTEKVIMNYIYNIDREQIDIEILNLEPGQNYHGDKLINDGIVVHTIGGDGTIGRRLEIKDFFACNKNKFDIVHIHYLSPSGAVIAYYAKKFGCKAVIYHSHISNNNLLNIKYKALKLLLNMVTDYKFACSEVAGKFMYYGKFKIVKNAIDLDCYAYNELNRNDIRLKYGITDDTLLLGNIGRLDEQKYHKYLIDIVHGMSKTDSKIRALIVGTGHLEKELREYAIAKGVEDKIIFALAQPDAYKYYSAFDILVFPSIYEGLSLVLVEAQANGLPIVYSENLTDEAKMLNNVKLLPNKQENIGEWINAIYDMKKSRISDPKKILTDNGFDIKDISAGLEKLYLDIVANKNLPVF